jgi:hypothetical protein
VRDLPPWREIACGTAEELLEALSPASEYFRGADHGDWVFRGQANANWGLSPSAFRPNPLLFDPLVADPFDEWYNAHQMAAELHALIRFFNLADSSGLPLPEDSQRIRFLLRDMQDRRVSRPHYSEAAPWPPSELWSLLGLAQHHEIPTRLLDWTRNSFTAAYFAAATNAANPSFDRLAIWAYHAKMDEMGVLAAKISGYTHTVQIVTAPYANNPNLRAQEGLFIILASSEPLDPKIHAQRYDLTDALASVRNVSGHTALLKFTAPVSECRAVLRLLQKFRVTPATLFPGYAGVVAAMREEELWRTRSRMFSAGYEMKRRRDAADGDT